MSTSLKILLTGILAAWTTFSFSQTGSYTMSNQTVNDCESVLFDSGNNPLVAGDYDNNEDLTFTICVPGADSIVMIFTDFCTEYLFDSLRLFDGPDINAPQIGPTYTGDPVVSPGTVPSTVIATSGCLTLHFVSDGSVTCSGWEASWYTIVVEPEEPEFDPIPNPTCNSTSLTVHLDQPVPCDSVYIGAFELEGPNAPNIINAIPVNCMGSVTSTIDLILNPDISESGIYTLTFTSYFVDACNDLWELTAVGNFIVNDCPLNAEIIASADTICEGDCLDLEAEAFGGDSLTYTYAWSHGLPSNAGPHNVCPTITTTYSLTVDDAGPAAGDVATKTITVIPPPVFTNPPADTTICRNVTFWLAANPPGGVFKGPGMIDNDTLSGRFRAWRAGNGIHTVSYTDGYTGCSTAAQIEVIPFSAGGTQGACPGSAPFTVNGGNPSGGYWQGPFIDSAGVFDPSTSGSFVVTYYAPNGCSGAKRVNVDSLFVQGDDTVCITLTPYYAMTFAPTGGSWSGPGIINSFWGRIDPVAAGPGLHTYTYTMIGGCTDTVNLLINDIDAGTDLTACPLQTPFTIPPGNPAGGTWSGIGITDPAIGLYDPSVMGGSNFNDTLTYNLGGCTDTKIVYVRRTRIGEDTLRFCAYVPEVPLDYANTGRTPGDGIWSGMGITSPSFPGIFSPQTAGAGIHKLYYDDNTCRDSLYMVVIQQPEIDSVQNICIKTAPFNLTATPPGGVWNHYMGAGIVDPFNGTFDPQLAGVGNHVIIYLTLPDSCFTYYVLTVDSLLDVSLSGLNPVYCYRDTNILINSSPPGGVYTGEGVVDSFFNPLQAGPGSHVIKYTVGTGDCAVTDSFRVFVGDSLEVTVNITDTTLCYGDFVNISVLADAGTGSSYTYSWSHGLGSAQFQTVSPLSNTVYTVTVTDGCTEPVIVPINVDVYPKDSVSYITNGMLCYGEEGFADLTVTPGSNYSYRWNTNPVQMTKDLVAPVSSFYTVTITNENTGCVIEESIDLPGYERLRASFSPNPPDDCITLQDPFYEFIDLSEGVTEGRWNFGDGNVLLYDYGLNPLHEYRDTGRYMVSLYANNEGACRDTFQVEVCVEQAPLIFAPNSFTPNGDGLNDEFKVTAFGLTHFEMYIYNRWGELLFESHDINTGWDGTHNDEQVPTGGYPYVIYYEGNMVAGRQAHKGMIVIVR